MSPPPWNTTGQDAIGQDAMSQHTINQQFGQLNAPDNGLKALQVQREELNDNDIYGCTGESTIMFSTSTEQSQPTAIATDVDAEWEMDGDLMGKEVIDGEVYYLVPWKPTLVPATMMQNALELINRFEARFGAQSGKSVEGPRLAKKIATSQKASQHGKDTTARRRGRPRKQRVVK